MTGGGGALVMTIHPLSPDGFRYLIESVTRQDEPVERSERHQRVRGALGEYYLRTGNPPGRWLGALAPSLGLSGAVTETQMERLFGRGQHPQTGAQLGRRYGRFAPLEVRVAERLRALAPAPDRGQRPGGWGLGELSDGELAELDGYARAAVQERSNRRIGAGNEELAGLDGYALHAAVRAQEQPRSRNRVAGVDLVFSPPKSVQSLWALATITGDAPTRDRVEGWVRAGRDTALRRLETEVAFGRLGAGGRVWVPVDGVAAAAFLHRCSRAGDPNLHWHVAVAAKVRVRDQHGLHRWVALDTKVLHKAAVWLSETFNAEVERQAMRDGYRFQPRRDQAQHGSRAVRELLGIPEELNRAWSRRRAQVEDHYQRLLVAFRSRQGRDPQRHEQYRLAQQACLTGRPQKVPGLGPEEEIATWQSIAHGVLGPGTDLRQVIAATRQGAPFAARDERIAVRLRQLQQRGAGAARAAGHPQRPAVPALSDGELAELDGYALAAVRNSRGAVEGGNAGLLGLDGYTQLAAVTAQEEARTPGVRAADIRPATATELLRRTVAAVADTRPWWTARHLHAEAERQTRGIPFATADDRRQVVTGILTAATTPDRYLGAELGLVIRAEHRSVVPEPARLLRAGKESAFREPAATEYTTTRMMRAEDNVLRAARAGGGPRIAAAAVERAIAGAGRRGRILAADQQAAVRALAGSGRWLDLLIGPAGAGKTTTLRVLVQAAHADGWTVVALAPSANAARILGEQTGARIVENTRQWEQYLATGRVRPAARTLVLIDESTLGHTPTLEAVITPHVAAGGIIRLVGDPRQLAAPGAGGLLRWLHQQHGGVELSSLWRFRHRWEAAATLRLRDGDPAVIQTYLDHNRIRHGSNAQMKDDLYRWWRSQHTAGRTALMIVQSNADMAALSARARRDLIDRGLVDAAGTRLRDGNHAGRGDQVVTRHIDRQLRYHRGRDYVRNGDVWQVRHRHHDGSLTLRHATNQGRIRIPAAWLEQWTELAYAVTAARAQGMTVHAAGCLLHPESTSRNAAYVQLTRGTDTNLAFLVTDTVLDPDGDPPRPQPDPDPHAALTAILTREQDDTVAHERLTHATQTERSIRTLGARYRHVHDLLLNQQRHTNGTAAAADPVLDPDRDRDRDRSKDLHTALPPQLAHAVTTDPAWPALAARLQAIAAAGHDPAAELTAAAAERELATAHSPAQVLHWRLGNRIPDLHHAEQPATTAPWQHLAAAPWLPTPPADPPRHAADLTGYLNHTAAAIHARAAELAAAAAATAPVWTAPLGPAPTGPDRPNWLLLAARIAAYRETFAIDDPQPLGPAPTQPSRGQRAAHDDLQQALDRHQHPPEPGHPNPAQHPQPATTTNQNPQPNPPAPAPDPTPDPTRQPPEHPPRPPHPHQPFTSWPHTRIAAEIGTAHRAATRAHHDADVAAAQARRLTDAADAGHGPAARQLQSERDTLRRRVAAIAAAEPVAAAYRSATDDLAALERAQAAILRRLSTSPLPPARRRHLSAHAAALEPHITRRRAAVDEHAARLGHATATAGPTHEWQPLRQRHALLEATATDAQAAAQALDRAAAAPWYQRAEQLRARAARHTAHAAALHAEQHRRQATDHPTDPAATETGAAATSLPRPISAEPDVEQHHYPPPPNIPHQPTQQHPALRR
jgi:conjugative relaxase-like TrwC/TraI family protein